MWPKHLVKINFDDAAEIASLYGIGPSLADRIVEWRTTHGDIKSPDDLSRVDGMNVQLALTLSPHIDWSIHDAKLTPSQGPIEPYFFLFAAFVIIMLAILAHPDYFELDNVQPQLQNSLFSLVLWLAQIGLLMGVLCTIIPAFIAFLDSNQTRRRRLIRFSALFTGVLGLSLFVMGLCNLIAYLFVIPYGSAWLLNNLSTLSLTLLLIISPLLFFPPAIVAIRPETIDVPAIPFCFDIGLVLMPVLYAIELVSPKTYVLPMNNSPFISIVEIVMAAALMLLGVTGLFSRQSVLVLIVSSFAVSNQSSTARDLKRWKIWVNTSLPNPTEQLDLRDALLQMHPPSRTRAVLNVIFLGATAWVFLAVLESVIGHFVESWLSNLNP